MADPMSLKSISTMVCMRALLAENPVEELGDNGMVVDKKKTEIRPYLTKLLETDSFTAVSEEILYRIVKFCPSHLSNSLLHALIPPYKHDLNLSQCRNVRIMGLVETFKKCTHVRRINLTACTQLIHPDIFTFMSLVSVPITTVIVEENANITDEVVHAMLSNLPFLDTLNISSCPNTSDEVFLFDEDVQLPREVSLHPIKGDKYSCNLTSVDISGCHQLTSAAVKNLVSLCGPKLTDVNISWTSVNCTALLHLAGYSLPAILDFMLTDDALKSDKELKAVLQYYRELRDIYFEQLDEDLYKEQQPLGEYKSDVASGIVNTANELKENTSMDENSSCNSIFTDEKSGDILNDTDIKVDIAKDQAGESHNEASDMNSENVESLISKLALGNGEKDEKTEGNEIAMSANGHSKDTVLDENGDEASENNDGLVERDKDTEKYRIPEAQSRKSVYFRNGVEVNYEEYYNLCSDYGYEEDDADAEICDEGMVEGAPLEKDDNSKKNKDNQKPAASVPIGSDKLYFEYTTQIYEPKILKLAINGMKFVSRRPILGQLCLEKFLEGNKGLQKFAVSWKGLTVDFFKKIVHNLTELVEVDLEECTMLTSAGVASLGRNCKKCRSLNLRGVVFISDGGLMPFLTNKNLEHISLAESDNITDRILIQFSEHLNTSLTSLDLSWCEEITETGINAICSSCTNLKRLWLRKCPVSDFTFQVLSESSKDLVEISVESTDTDGMDNLTDQGILTIANTFTNLRIIDISWNLALTDLSVSAVMMNCCLLEEANLKGLKQITIEPFLPIISILQNESEKEASARQSSGLPYRSTVYVPNLRVLDLDYSDLVDDQLLQKIVNVCRGTLQVTDYYGQKLEPE